MKFKIAHNIKGTMTFDQGSWATKGAAIDVGMDRALDITEGSIAVVEVREMNSGLIVANFLAGLSGIASLEVTK